MARINLLPWREELRKQREKEFYQYLGVGALFGAIIVAAVHMNVAGMIENQQQRNGFMREEIKGVEAKIKKIQELETKRKQLVSRMRVIERLQSNRPEIVHIFEEIVRVTPEGLYLTDINQHGDTFSISGYAQSNARVSKLMRGLEQSKWFQEPKLDVIQSVTIKNQPMRQFKLTVKQRNNVADDAG